MKEILEARSLEEFERWLREFGKDKKEIWVVIYKKSAGKQRVSFDQLLEAALCYGWIDGREQSVDAERYALRFTPRGKKSTWSERNRAIAQRLLQEGRMTEAGEAVLPEDLRRGANG